MMRISEITRRLSVVTVERNVEDALLTGVSTDSRSVSAGQLFVALKGENFDAHEFLAQVKARGAAAAVVSRRVDCDLPQLLVGDTMLALGLIAQWWRSRFSLPILALTGSNGKTTVKEMLRSILAAHLKDEGALLATEGNLNNNIGVPQMLLRLRPAHRLAVFEMGMNHLLEIDYLTRLVAPDVALINMAGTAHIGEVGSREAIAQAKGEIFSGLREGGVACINMDDRFANYWCGLNEQRRVLRFGFGDGVDVQGQPHESGIRLCVDGDSSQQIEVRLQVAGEHNRRNALAAAAGAHALGVPLSTIGAGLEAFTGVAGRLQRYHGRNGATLIDDTYNANPDSMRAAIEVLAAYPGQRVVVLGDMAELGVDAAAMHAEIGHAAREAGLDALYAVGSLSTHYVNAFGEGVMHFASIDTLLDALGKKLAPSMTVLVKGSRSARLERVVKPLLATSIANATADQTPARQKEPH